MIIFFGFKNIAIQIPILYLENLYPNGRIINYNIRTTVIELTLNKY